MANANTAILLMLKNEGGYNRAKPGAGETYKGIDRVFSKPWPQGWALIDNYKKTYGVPKEETYIKNAQLDILVADFYYKNIWPESGVQQISNTDFASLFFDFYVHKPAVAVLACNEIANKIAPTATKGISLSPAVAAAINKNVQFFYSELYKIRIAHYYNNYYNAKFDVFYSAKKNGSQKGVLARARRFASTIASVAKKAIPSSGWVVAVAGFFLLAL